MLNAGVLFAVLVSEMGCGSGRCLRLVLTVVLVGPVFQEAQDVLHRADRVPALPVPGFSVGNDASFLHKDLYELAVRHLFGATEKLVPLFIREQIRFAQLPCENVMLAQNLQQLGIPDRAGKITSSADHAVIAE